MTATSAILKKSIIIPATLMASFGLAAMNANATELPKQPSCENQQKIAELDYENHLFMNISKPGKLARIATNTSPSYTQFQKKVAKDVLIGCSEEKTAQTLTQLHAKMTDDIKAYLQTGEKPMTMACSQIIRFDHNNASWNLKLNGPFKRHTYAIINDYRRNLPLDFHKFCKEQDTLQALTKADQDFEKVYASLTKTEKKELTDFSKRSRKIRILGNIAKQEVLKYPIILNNMAISISKKMFGNPKTPASPSLKPPSR